MFSPKDRSKNNRHLITMAAVAAASLAWVSAAHAWSQDNEYWDPTFTGTVSGGGSGTFDNSTFNFYSASYGEEAIFLGSNGGSHGSYAQADIIHFANTGGTVNVATPTTMGEMYIDCDGYTFTGATITLGGGYHPTNPVLSMKAGTATIQQQVDLYAGQAVSVSTGATLNVGTLNNVNGWGSFTKDGGGVLNVTANLWTGGTFYLNGGTVVVHGSNNWCGGTTVAAGAILAGDGMNGGGWNPGTSWAINGTLAPGANASQFGAIGTFELNLGAGANYLSGVNVTFATGSKLAVDLASPDINADGTAGTPSHDVFHLTGTTYNTSPTVLDFEAAKLEINIPGTVVPGTYHIVTTTADGSGLTIADNGLKVDQITSTDPNWNTYTYNLQDVAGGIDLVIKAAVLGSNWSGAVDGTWSTPGNWSSVPAAGGNATFGASSRTSITVDSATTGNLTFTTAAASYTIGGNAITFDNGGSLSQVSVSGGAQIINSAVVLNNAIDIAADTGTVNFTGGFTGNGSITLQNNGTTDGAVTLSGAQINNVGSITNRSTGSGTAVISASIGSNVVSVNQNSASSTMALTADNVASGFAGSINLNSGSLSFANNSLGTGKVYFAGGTLQWAPGNTQDVTGQFDTLARADVKLDINGNNITLPNPLSQPDPNNPNTLTVSSATGGGTLTLTGVQGYTGTTTVNSGTVMLAPGAAISGALAVNGGTFEYNGNLGTTTLYDPFNSGTISNNGTRGVLNVSATIEGSNTGNGTWTGNMDIDVSLSGGGRFTAALVNNTGTFTVEDTYNYGGVHIGTLGSNVTTVNYYDGYGALRLDNVTVNSAGTVINNAWGTGNQNGQNVFIGNVNGTGNLTLNGPVHYGISGTVANDGVLIDNSTDTSYLYLSDVRNLGVTQGTGGTQQIQVTGVLTIQPAGFTLTKSVNSGGNITMIETASVVGSGDLKLANNDNPVYDVDGTTVLDGKGLFINPNINHAGSIINLGTGTAATTVSGYRGTSIGSNVVAVRQESSTSPLLLTAPVSVNAGGITLANNGGAQFDVYSAFTGSGNVILQNNTNKDGAIYTGCNFNNNGQVINSGNGTGNMVLQGGDIGANVTAIVQNSPSSMLVIGDQTSTAAVSVQNGHVRLTGSVAGSVTVHSAGVLDATGGMAALTTVSGAKLEYDPASSDLQVTGGASAVTIASGTVLDFTGGTLGTANYLILGYADTNALTNWNNTTGTIAGGTLSVGTLGTFSLGTGWAAAGDGSFTITNDAANGGIYLDFTSAAPVAGSGTWTGAATTADWSDPANWTPGTAGGAGSVATFDGSSSVASVNVNNPVTLGSIALSNAKGNVNYTLSGSTITMDNTGGTGNASIAASGVTHTISAPITSTAGDLDVNVTSGILALNAINNTGKIVNVNAAGSIVQMNGAVSGDVHLNSGTLGGTGSIAGTLTPAAGVVIHPSAGLATSATSTLTVGTLATSGTTLKFNLVSPDVDHTDGSRTASVNDLLSVTNLNANGGTIDVTNHVTGGSTLGYYKIMTATNLTGSLGSITMPAIVNGVSYFLTTSHDAGFIDLHRGYAGDANDSGFVDLTDLTVLANNWQKSADWNGGDFSGDGKVDLTDLTILANNWQTGVGAFGAAADSLSGAPESFYQAVQSVVFAGSVPEPTSLALLGLGAAGLLARRRRR